MQRLKPGKFLLSSTFFHSCEVVEFYSWGNKFVRSRTDLELDGVNKSRQTKKLLFMIKSHRVSLHSVGLQRLINKHIFETIVLSVDGLLCRDLNYRIVEHLSSSNQYAYNIIDIFVCWP